MNIVKLLIRTPIKLLWLPVAVFVLVLIFTLYSVRWIFFAPFNLVLWAFDDPLIKLEDEFTFEELMEGVFILAVYSVSDFLPTKYKSYYEMQRELHKEKV